LPGRRLLGYRTDLGNPDSRTATRAASSAGHSGAEVGLLLFRPGMGNNSFGTEAGNCRHCGTLGVSGLFLKGPLAREMAPRALANFYTEEKEEIDGGPWAQAALLSEDDSIHMRGSTSQRPRPARGGGRGRTSTFQFAPRWSRHGSTFAADCRRRRRYSFLHAPDTGCSQSAR